MYNHQDTPFYGPNDPCYYPDHGSQCCTIHDTHCTTLRIVQYETIQLLHDTDG